MGSASRILVVDDDPLMREIASAKLSEAGYLVESANDGSQAFAKLGAAYDSGNEFDLVVSDIDMPNMSGYDLTKAMRKSEPLSSTPVIVITSSDHPEAVDKAFSVGATSFVSKPVNWPLLGHAARFVLKAARDQIALREARDQADAAAQFKDGLMSIMSHELRTPLNAIIGFGQIISDQFNNDADHVHREYAEYIVDGGKRLLNSVSDMLLASDARSGPIEINDIDCTIEDLIALAVNACSKQATLAETEIKQVIHAPDLEVRCDRQLFSRALQKLIDNAIKFGERGRTITVGTAMAPNGDLAFLIKDNGPGIPPEKLAVVSQPFAQSDMSLRRSTEGLGLGLPLVQAIAAAHGAIFKLDSSLGEGTSALLVLPNSRINPTMKDAPQTDGERSESDLCRNAAVRRAS
ncbi:MAG: hybrid sensor histidine kinase/response regulator [Pseudomonadota bacterium]